MSGRDMPGGRYERAIARLSHGVEEQGQPASGCQIGGQ